MKANLNSILFYYLIILKNKGYIVVNTRSKKATDGSTFSRFSPTTKRCVMWWIAGRKKGVGISATECGLFQLLFEIIVRTQKDCQWGMGSHGL
jgi:hypothetical protein